MRVGIGVITMGVRGIHPNIPALCRDDAVIRVQTDFERVGPARTRNACMQYLLDQGCEHIFMFDDDCYPVRAGWEDYFIAQHQASGIAFLGLPESFTSRPLAMGGEVLRWDGIVGCFSSQTRACIETLGGYNTDYQRYGFEDSARNLRARNAGLCGAGEGFPSPLRAMAYIHSEDVYAENPVPNLSAEEKAHFIALNRGVWLQEVRGGRIHYPLQVVA